MIQKHGPESTFYGVALAFIILGTIIFIFGLMGWYIAAISGIGVIAYPFFKAIGGLLVMGLGYVILEMEMLRKK